MIQNRFLPRAGLLLLLLALAGTSGAATEESTSESVLDPAVPESTPASSNIFFPVLGYTPETEFLAGATWLRFFQLGDGDDQSRPSLLSPVMLVTTKKQIMIQLGSDLYWDSSRNHAKISPGFTYFPDSFFGLGRDTREADEEDYTSQQVSLDLLYERKVLGHLFAGAVFDFKRHELKEIEEGGQLASGSIRGTGKTTLTAPGLRLAWDDRDHTMTPHTGSFAQAQVKFYGPSLGSDFSFTEYNLDLRRYWSLGTKGTLAAQVMGQAQEGSPPFFVLAKLGGFDGLRGYLSGRYPDQALLLGRVEWRSPYLYKGLAGTVFAGYGDVAPSLGELTTAGQLYTYGLGLRISLNREQKVNLRLDMGFGNGDSGFYVGLGEAF